MQPELRDTIAPVDCPQCGSSNVELEKRFEKWWRVCCRNCPNHGADSLEQKLAVEAWNKKALGVVRAIKVEKDYATCPCGERIKLNREGRPLEIGGQTFFGELAAVNCPKCKREVWINSDKPRVQITRQGSA